MLGMDRTVIHRAVKAMVKEGLLTERRETEGRAIAVKLSTKGIRFRAGLIEARVAADRAISAQMPTEDRQMLLRLLKLVAECEF